jgi:dolichol-phosphate mannosyltransferase
MDGPQHIATLADCSLSLIIPAYNEEPGIGQAIAEADAALSTLGCAYEILIVDDGSQDGTAAAVREAARTHPRVRLLKHTQNRGYGAALLTGFEAAQFDHIAFTDADCQFDLTDLGRLLPLTDTAPLAVGYRLHRQDPWLRRFFSWGYNQLARTLLGTRVRDCDCALKVFRREALAQLLPESRGFFVNSEMLSRANRLRFPVREVGVRHRPRLHGDSKVSLRDIPRTLGALLPFWWSNVLFAGRTKPAPEAIPVGASRILPLVLFLLASLLFFTRLSCPLLEPEEARYAEIPRQMLEEGRWVTPVLHGQPYYHKPPLLYWLVMVSYSLFGVHDWAARLVPSGAGVLLVGVTYFWGRRTLGTRGALAGALILCLSVRFVYLGRMLTFDTLLALWVVGALAAGHLAIQGPRFRSGWWLLSALLSGLGLLTKGPVTLILVLVPLVLYRLLDRRACRFPAVWWLSYLAVAAAVASPWYIALLRLDPGAAGEFFWQHNLVRFWAPFDHAKPVWFYLPSLFVGMLPWSLLLVPLFQMLARRSGTAPTQQPPALGFYLLAFLWGLLFFSLAGCKRAAYILPVIPPLALVLGWVLDRSVLRLAWYRARLDRPRMHLRTYARRCHRAALLTLGIGMVAVVASVGAALTSMVIASVSIGAVMVALGWLWRRRHDCPAPLALGVCGLTMFALLFAGIHQILPGYARKYAIRGQVRHFAEVAASEHLPVVCYPRRWDSVSFYLRRSDVSVYPAQRREELIARLQEHSRTLVFVKGDASNRYLRELLEGLPSWLQFVPYQRKGRIVAGVIRWRSELGDDTLAKR